MRAAALLTGALLAVRALLLPAFPITDPTESRYAMIAVRMLDSGDWVIPRVTVRGEVVPYMGKPPLHFWITTVCMDLFGPSATTARLPSLLAGGLAAFAVFRFADPLAALILVSSGLFWICLGASIVDMTLAACVTIAMTSFAGFTRDGQRGSGLLFFAALGLGFLTKGPVALALVALPLLLWAGLTGRWRDLLRLPWVQGVVLVSLMIVPWFILAERANPGLIKYFLLNENLGRFFLREYGDLYGAGHRQPFGAIWPVLVVGFLPWSVPLLLRLRPKALRADPWLLFAVLWGISPALIFTIARQWLPAYVLPGLPGLAAATGMLVGSVDRAPRRWLIAASVLPLLTLIALPFIRHLPAVEASSSYSALRNHSGDEVAFIPFAPDSARFYVRTECPTLRIRSAVLNRQVAGALMRGKSDRRWGLAE